MKVAVFGGGIHGVMIAWELARQGCVVEVFERDRLMRATSSASSKLLHGGLRYLEYGHLGLVLEGIRERAWWLTEVPELTRTVQMLIPRYPGIGRPRWQTALGVALYDLLARGSGLPRSRWMNRQEVRQALPTLKRGGLRGALAYAEGLMLDDLELGLWAVAQARAAGVLFHEGLAVSRIDPNQGEFTAGGERRRYDRLVNATGPWALRLLQDSGLTPRLGLTLIRGSHLLLPGRMTHGCVLQIPGERRIVFVLPHKGLTLLGTTEVRQEQPEIVPPTGEEISYLLDAYNLYFDDTRNAQDIITAYAGVRPVVATEGTAHTAASREASLEVMDRLITVFGGKWTTSRALALRVVRAVQGNTLW